MNSRWVCVKCSSWNDSHVTRCSFCGEPKETLELNSSNPDSDPTTALTQRLHNIVEKLTPLQKQKLFRYFEDNVL